MRRTSAIGLNQVVRPAFFRITNKTRASAKIAEYHRYTPLHISII